ncbi:gliding motility protein GldM [Bacteroides sp. UBA939]|uniref:type IX secretion system motor protein PorM/GldM n=1 Tax=Bacteroides sp. UBA939 TaxID=1946092 RepID=UPI0025BB0DF1|nr:gliding motility protein GldM [Bacteroides sp. UBA939]
MSLNTNPNSPRQKMINLMYIVLMALLALNVSSDVLNGFSLVDESLSRTTANSTVQNQSLYEGLAEANTHNPEKVGPWFEKAVHVKNISDSLYAYVNQLKQRIVKEADGEDGDIADISNREDLEAASYVMLAPGSGQGKELYNRINRYREEILALVTDPVQQQIIRDNLTTEVPRKILTTGKNWQEYIFENTPVAAAITLLTKLQSDVRYAEGEVLHLLTQNTDVQDVRVNQLQAYVIPTAQNVVRGGTYSGRVILAAVDSTQRPSIYIAGEKQPDNAEGWFETVCNRTGEFSLDGYLELTQKDGEVLRRDFSQKYTVVEPTATVSATMMNVLYAGYDNPVSVSVPGVPAGQVQASIVNGNGTLTRSGNGYIAHPTTIGKDAVIRVTASVGGRTQSMGDYTYRVRQLPDPSPFIEYTENGTPKRYRGGRGLPKAILMNAPGIVAAIDDGLLNINFRVLGFETVFFDNMGNAVPEVSSGASFSTRQKDMFRQLSRGKRFYISRVRAIGPDGVERLLPTTLEVIVN